MHIGFDAKRAFHNSTGLGNYSRDTIGIVAEYFRDTTINLYDPKPKEGFNFHKQFSNIAVKSPIGNFYKKMHALWRSIGIKKQLLSDKIEIYHGLSNELPAGISKTKIKTVVTIHDVIFMRYPELYPRFDRIIYQKKTVRACQEADLIIAISEQTSQDLQFYFDVPKSKIRVVYQGCHPIFKVEAQEQEKSNVRKKYGIPERFLLSVGRIEERKNIIHLLQALKQTKNIPLVLVGKPTDFQHKIEKFVTENGLQDRVQIRNNVPLSDLTCLYQMAEVFVYPSIFEGFGIPIIEALFSKTPVISSTGSCFSEAGGPSSKYCDPHNEQSLIHAIAELWGNKEQQKVMVEEGVIYSQKFQNKEIAKNLNAVYSELL
jgi:glycosyltransferase involved in cell wall biosynthesis